VVSGPHPWAMATAAFRALVHPFASVGRASNRFGLLPFRGSAEESEQNLDKYGPSGKAVTCDRVVSQKHRNAVCRVAWR